MKKLKLFALAAVALMGLSGAANADVMLAHCLHCICLRFRSRAHLFA
jgi:hypothetical protein